VVLLSDLLKSDYRATTIFPKEPFFNAETAVSEAKEKKG